MRKYKIAMVAGAVAALVFAATAFAGKPASSLEQVVGPSGTETAAASTPEPSYGGQITFDVQTTQSDRPFVNVRCYQGDSWVYDGWKGFYSSYYTEPVFTLSSGYWTGGAADCTARLLYYDRQGRDRMLATLDFHVTV